MKTRSPLTGAKHTTGRVRRGEARAGRARARRSRPPGRPPTSSGRSAASSAEILCPDSADDCPQVDTGGYHVITTLDWNMQKIAEKWVYVAARAPNCQGPQARPRQPQDPARRTARWILGLRGHNINNAAGAVIDYRTGDVLAYVGWASYTSKGNKKFQPQFDVLADGWRQPGSAIKPIDYLDRHRRQDADRLDDAHGRRDELRRTTSSRPRPTSSSAVRSGSARRSSSRSTSRPSRRRS